MTGDLTEPLLSSIEVMFLGQGKIGVFWLGVERGETGRWIWSSELNLLRILEDGADSASLGFARLEELHTSETILDLATNAALHISISDIRARK